MEALFVRIRPPLPVTCCFLTAVYLAGTIGTILGEVGLCQERRTTFCASLQSFGTGDFSLQSRSTRQNPIPEPGAAQRIGDALYTDTRLTIIQRNTIAAVIMRQDFRISAWAFLLCLGVIESTNCFSSQLCGFILCIYFPCAFLRFM